LVLALGEEADAIVLDPALVVEELRLLALQVLGELSDPLLRRGALGLLGPGLLVGCGLLTRGCGLGSLVGLGHRIGHFCSPSSPSSTISASTTSSSPASSPAGAPCASASAAAAAYIASPIFELVVPSLVIASRMASVSSPLSASLRASRSARTSALTSSPTLSSFSDRNFSVEWTSDSAWLRVSTASRRLRSSSAYCSASLIILSISSFDSAEPPVMVIDCSLPVPRSLAETLTMQIGRASCRERVER